MPPPTNTRKPSTTTTSSGRAVRANTTRPANYYARSYASTSANNAADNADEQGEGGFFPALTFFTDAINALPKEVMRQFTLMKEVEAKIHANHEKLGEVVEEVMAYPVPRRKTNADVGGGGEAAGPSVGQGVFSLTANNSVMGSASGSVVNGVGPVQHSAQNSVAGSFAGEEAGAQAGNEDDMAKRKKYHELRNLIATMLPNLDEKGVVLSEANRVLSRQHLRIDSVWPHLDEEISDVARYGSMTHWAYSDNRQRKQVPGTVAGRRDVAGTNNLAAAANAIHEHEIATARRDAVREGREKQKGKSREQLDSDLDDKPRKTTAKIGRMKPGPAGLGISANGEPVKRRKVDKALGAPAMERSLSTKAAKKEARSSTPVAEGSKKAKTKPAALLAKKKGITSAHGSPALASSPLHSSFTTAAMEPPPASRPQPTRMRTGSSATNLRHEKLANEEPSRPTSAPKLERGRSKRKAAEDLDDLTKPKKTTESSDGQARNDGEASAAERPPTSRSHSNSGKAGRGSAAGTPRSENFPERPGEPKRTRSTRSARKDEDSSAEPQTQSRHKRVASNSHLVKQLASFNRSPDLDRHRDSDDDDSSGENKDSRKRTRDDDQSDERSPRKRRTASRRNTLQQAAAASSPVQAAKDDEGDTTMPDIVASPQQSPAAEVLTPPPASEPPAAASPSPAPSSEAADPVQQHSASPSSIPADALADEHDDTLSHHDLDEAVEDVPSLDHDDVPEEEEAADLASEDDSESGDPDDPNEPKYCYCNRGSYGEMIACDNESCAREWFHLGCTGLREPPEEEEKWYCVECAPLFEGRGSGRGRGRGGGRGRGRRAG